MVFVKSISKIKNIHPSRKRSNERVFNALRKRLSEKTKTWPKSEELIRAMRENRYGRP